LKPGAPQISSPVKPSHDFSITFNPETGAFSGVPQDILDAIKNAGHTMEEVAKNPLLVKDLLYNFDYNSLKPGAPKISSPIQSSHDFQIRIDPATGQVTGIPEPVLEAIRKAGHTLEQVVANPELVKELLYSLDYEQLKESSSPVSRPVNISHDFSIAFDPETGKFTGIPPAIEEAITKAGLTVEQVTKNPALIKDLLYQFDYESVKNDAIQVSRPTNVKHDFSIKYNPNTGTIEGVPEEIRRALLAKGFTEAEVLKEPTTIAEFLYSLDYDKVKKGQAKEDN